MKPNSANNDSNNSGSRLDQQMSAAPASGTPHTQQQQANSQQPQSRLAQSFSSPDQNQQQSLQMNNLNILSAL
jgi:hypothetical protein